ncbi:MAG: hypothetical protein JXQ27_15665, partial [Acidobacteria bacterium]|nr:hypothetical protein [Acidobacteriota bacterium]
MLCFGLVAGLWRQAPVVVADPPPDARKIVSRMEEVRQRTHEEIRQYSSYRNYLVHNERFDFSRGLPVRMDYTAPWSKEYSVPAEQASGIFYSK